MGSNLNTGKKFGMEWIGRLRVTDDGVKSVVP